MKKNTNRKNWQKEFNQIKDNDEFKEYYIDVEDKWLQYSDWDKKIKGIFGNCKNAVISFHKFQLKTKTR